MRWLKRLLLAAPFAVAALLNILLLGVDRFHLRREHVAGYCFLFGAPWAWLLDWGWLPHSHSGWLRILFGYALILWIPAALYFACVWLLLLGLAKIKTKRPAP
jgi:hypothetical protein